MPFFLLLHSTNGLLIWRHHSKGSSLWCEYPTFTLWVLLEANAIVNKCISMALNFPHWSINLIDSRTNNDMRFMLSPQWAKSSVLRRLIKGALVAINNELIDALKNCGFFPPILLDYISRLIILFFSRWLENISASGMDSNLCDLLTAARATLPSIQIHPSSQWSPAISLCLSPTSWMKTLGQRGQSFYTRCMQFPSII